MPVHPKFCRRSLRTCAALLAGVAVLVTAYVAPAVRADAFEPESAGRAVSAFWGVAATAAVTGVLLALMAQRTRQRNVFTLGVLGLASVSILLLGLLLNDAAVAYWAHGPELRGAALAAFVCAGTCLVTATTVLSTAFLLPGRMAPRA